MFEKLANLFVWLFYSFIKNKDTVSMYQVFNDLFVNIYMMTFNVAVQCDPDPLLHENMASKAELRKLKGHKWSVEKIEDDHTKTELYIGLPSFAVFR